MFWHVKCCRIWHSNNQMSTNKLHRGGGGPLWECTWKSCTILRCQFHFKVSCLISIYFILINIFLLCFMLHYVMPKQCKCCELHCGKRAFNSLGLNEEKAATRLASTVWQATLAQLRFRILHVLAAAGYSAGGYSGPATDFGSGTHGTRRKDIRNFYSKAV